MEAPRLNKTRMGSSGCGPLGFDYMNLRTLRSCIHTSVHLLVHLSAYVCVGTYVSKDTAFMHSHLRSFACSLVRLCVCGYVCVHECLYSLLRPCTYPFSRLNISHEHYLFNHKYLLGCYRVPGVLLDAGNLIVNQMARFFSSRSSGSSSC